MSAKELTNRGSEFVKFDGLLLVQDGNSQGAPNATLRSLSQSGLRARNCLLYTSPSPRDRV
eukprot:4474564-Amphidinium_carterae.1